ncbi:IS110 family transposase [Tateyamaria sp. SN3-11]|uniref:IS110 family transposase n=1 Tax=Tateyamaria sp. SN3-11 TaxID=3092147 RepID=UPI0039ED32A5
MSELTIGVDIAKRVFQVHVIDEVDQILLNKKLRRTEFLAFFVDLPPSLIGMESCGTAHHWARELIAMGHQVKLMTPKYVKPYVKRGKNDAVDAEAICEAVTRPTMRFVPVKTVDQQSVLMIHRTRSLLIRQRTMLVNALRGHLAEIGIVAPVGIERVGELVDRVLGYEGDELGVPSLVRSIVESYAQQIMRVTEEVKNLETQLRNWHRTSEVSRRLATIPGIGRIIATALAATVSDPDAFRSGRSFAAWLGLTPKSNSSGGKERNGRITKAGDRHLRTLLVLGATSVIRRVRSGRATPLYCWVTRLVDTGKPPRLVTVALANKIARIAWAVMAGKADYQPEKAALAA